MNLLDLAVKIGVEDNATKKTSSIASGIVSKMSGAASKVASAAKVGAAAVSAAYAAAAAAVSAFATMTVGSYSTYEQQVGGIAKLYGNAGQSLEDYAAANNAAVEDVQAAWERNEAAQAAVMANAQKAWQTTGQSANDYMETATQFSASLISSVGGDTQRAADLTDVAMRAMSDNVNTFGSNFEDVSNAFKGFSKQNYTMLDNLKLGYGGTQKEMERLIDDANKYRASIGESSDLTIDSFADIVTAVESIQEKMQIAGTTGREAMSTIEGSTNALKAAWENFGTTVGGGEGDLRESFGNVNEAALAVAQNVVPAFTTALDNLGDLFATGFPVTIANIQYIIGEYAPQIANAFGHLFDGIGTFLEKSGPHLAWYVGMKLNEIITNAVPAAANAIPGVVETLGTLGASFISGLLPEKLATPIESIITTISETLSTVFGDLATNAGEVASPGVDLLTGAFELLDAILTPIGDAIQAVSGFISDILTAAVTGFSDVAGDKLPAASTAFSDFKTNATQVVDDVTAAVQPFVSALCTALANIGTAFDGLKTAVQPVIDTVTSFLDGVVSGAAEKFETDLQPALENLSTAWGNLQTALQPVTDAIGGFITQLVGGAEDSVSGALQSASDNADTAGESFGGGLVEGIAGALNTVAAIIQGIADVIDKISAFVTAVQEIPGNIGSAIEEWKQKFDDVKTAVVSKFDDIKTKVGEFVTSFPEQAKQAVEDFKTAFKSKFDEVVEFAGSIPGQIKDAIVNAPASLFQAGADMMQGFWDGLKSIGDSVYNWAAGVADTVAANKGPLSYDRIVLIPNGMAMMSGFQSGLSKGFGGVLDEVQTYADDVASAASVKVRPSLDFESLGVKGGYGEMQDGVLTVYNVNINDARVNQDVSQMTGDYLLELARVGAL